MLKQMEREIREKTSENKQMDQIEGDFISRSFTPSLYNNKMN
jgi:hypothetical protein